MKQKQQDDNKLPGFGDTARFTLNVFVLAGQVTSMGVTPYLRRFGSWGKRYAGVHMLFGLIFQFFFLANWDLILAHRVLYATVAMLLIHRIAGLRRSAFVPRLYIGVSRFPGHWRLAIGTWEPLFVFTCGILALYVSEGIALYLILASIGLTVSYAYTVTWMNAQADALNESRAVQMTLKRHYDERMGR